MKADVYIDKYYIWQESLVHILPSSKNVILHTVENLPANKVLIHLEGDHQLKNGNLYMNMNVGTSKISWIGPLDITVLKKYFSLLSSDFYELQNPDVWFYNTRSMLGEKEGNISLTVFYMEGCPHCTNMLPKVLNLSFLVKNLSLNVIEIHTGEYMEGDYPHVDYIPTIYMSDKKLVGDVDSDTFYKFLIESSL